MNGAGPGGGGVLNCAAVVYSSLLVRCVASRPLPRELALYQRLVKRRLWPQFERLATELVARQR